MLAMLAEVLGSTGLSRRAKIVASGRSAFSRQGRPAFGHKESHAS
jgi:hypothetical protein